MFRVFLFPGTFEQQCRIRLQSFPLSSQASQIGIWDPPILNSPDYIKPQPQSLFWPGGKPKLLPGTVWSFFGNIEFASASQKSPCLNLLKEAPLGSPGVKKIFDQPWCGFVRPIALEVPSFRQWPKLIIVSSSPFGFSNKKALPKKTHTHIFIFSRSLHVGGHPPHRLSLDTPKQCKAQVIVSFPWLTYGSQEADRQAFLFP